MALLFGLGGDKDPKKPIKNKRQKGYVINEPPKMGVGSKPSGTKTDVATKNSTYKNEPRCDSGKKNCGVKPPPVAIKVEVEKVKAPKISTDTETNRKPKTATTTTSTPTLPIPPKKNIASF